MTNKPLQHHNSQISVSDNLRILKKRNVTPEVQHINNKVAKHTGILTNLRHYRLDFHMLKQIYYALIYPYLSNGIFAWGCASNNRLNCPHTKQNKCLSMHFLCTSVLGRVLDPTTNL